MTRMPCRSQKVFTAVEEKWRVFRSMSSGPSESQICCSLSGSAHERKPLSKASYSIPFFSNCRLAHSCPFRHSLVPHGA